MKLKPVYITIVALVAIFGLFVMINKKNNSSLSNLAKKTGNIIGGGDGFSFNENTPGYETYLDLIQGCAFKDCIPAIDNPEFEGVAEADKWLDSEDVVFVLEGASETKIYSQRILNRHEIVNDVVSGEPLVITFCPLCGSALAFKRMVGEVTLDFGVSGKLHNNDLVMYDRQKQSLWQQITGEAIVGDFVGEKLEPVSFGVMIWADAKKKFPNAKSLERPSDSSTYNVYPYGDYEESPDPLFPIEGGVDNSIHPKEIVFGVELNGKYKAYPEKKLVEEETIVDQIDTTEIKIEYNKGSVKVTDLDSGQSLVATRLFWFAWKVFRPDTKLY